MYFLHPNGVSSMVSYFLDDLNLNLCESDSRIIMGT